MKNVAVMGASGRMGQEVISALRHTPGLQFTQGVSASHPDFIKAPQQLKGDDVDVVIDFSLPTAFDGILDWCVQNQKPLVSGTTGLTNAQFNSIDKAALKIPVLWSPNMSLGIAVMTAMLKNFSALRDADYGLEELHHIHKKDSPSGTALHLKKHLETSLNKSVDQLVSLRGGGIFGIHKVWAMTPEETITIEHSALNRSVFAKGALRAAQWLIGKPKGRYELADVLGLK